MEERSSRTHGSVQLKTCSPLFRRQVALIDSVAFNGGGDSNAAAAEDDDDDDNDDNANNNDGDN